MKKIMNNINKLMADMDNKMLMQQCLVTFALVVVMGMVLFSTYEETRATDANRYEGIIRLHVVANSDTTEDQELKLKVRDAIIEEVGKYDTSGGIEKSREELKSHLNDLTETANRVISENGCKYKASAELGVRWIPEKTYGDMYFPAGNYEALTITLGEGKGQNWWCVLFPPLCLITEDEKELEEMGIDSADQIQVKSWLKEVLKDE